MTPQMNLYGWRRVNPGHVREAGDEHLPTVRLYSRASLTATGRQGQSMMRSCLTAQIWRHDWLVQTSPTEELHRVRRHAPPKKRSARSSVEPPSIATSSVSSSPVSASPSSALMPWSSSPMPPGPSYAAPSPLISTSAPPQWMLAPATSSPGFYAQSMPHGFDFSRAAEAFEYVMAQRQDEERLEQHRTDAPLSAPRFQ